jgi:ankyrin repeat protein
MRFDRLSLSLILSTSLALAAGPDTRIADAVQNRDAATVRNLLKLHAAVNTQQADGMTAIIWAAHNDDVEMATLLVKSGADVKAVNRYGVTALTEAATIGDGPMVELLLTAGADANTTMPEGDTALLLASRSGGTAAVKALLDHGASPNPKESWHGETAMSVAASENHPEIIRLLVAKGGDVNAQGKKLDYPLIVKQDVMSLPPVGGLTPLMEAARNNAFEAAEALLKAGANPNLKTPDKMTALLVAITNAHWDVAKLLVDNGEDPNDGAVAQTEEARNAKNTLSRPVSLGPHAVSSIEVLQDLLAKGAKADSVIDGEVPTRSGGPGRGGDVPALSRAAKTADLEVMKMLIAAGANVKSVAKDGTTPIIASVGAGGRGGGGGGFGIGSKGATEEQRIEAIQMCLDNGANVNATDRTGQTALHAAAGAGDNKIVQYLADHGADINLKDKRERTPLDVALGKEGSGPPPEAGGGIQRAPDVHKDTAALLRKLMGLPAEEAEVSIKTDDKSAGKPEAPPEN